MLETEELILKQIYSTNRCYDVYFLFLPVGVAASYLSSSIQSTDFQPRMSIWLKSLFLLAQTDNFTSVPDAKASRWKSLF